ncbi:MAG: hypothetical protein M5U34_09885 [Chloroflexi bacterium]|nr:hypothetical protein [Chloroflexota bacterium]
MFEQPIGHHMTPLTGIANLWAMEIDPDSATEEYKERALAPLRDIFPAPMVEVINEQMSGPCTPKWPPSTASPTSWCWITKPTGR